MPDLLILVARKNWDTVDFENDCISSRDFCHFVTKINNLMNSKNYKQRSILEGLALKIERLKSAFR